ncbi:hypothetical protein HS7_17300 [Sulfolobales archaeon HS-7]|nr:hypothetical protein HS7_17300 [Sulfolobales archaeon HS-7]
MTVLTENSQQIREILPKLTEEMKGVCEIVKIGGNMICAPSERTLIRIFIENREFKPLALKVRVNSDMSSDVVRYTREISNIISSLGYKILMEE